MPEHYDLNDDAFSLPPKGKENPFALPPGYFDQVPATIMARIALLEELDQFPVLAAIHKEQRFITPAGYFAESENSLENAFEAETYKALEKAPKHLKVEEAYFERLDKRMALSLA